MKRPLKIAIYSGSIPSTTFIENLIEGLAEHEVSVLLFGKKSKRVAYNNKNIKVYGDSKNRGIRLVFTLFRSLLLLIIYPKRFSILINEIKSYSSVYVRWIWWSRYVPVVLYIPDIFHVQWAKDLEHWLFLKRKFNKKIILSLLGSHINYSPKVDKQLAKSYRENFSSVDAFHGVSQAIITEAKLYNNSLKNVKLIYTQLKPVTFEYFKNDKKEKINKLRILSVGRHHWVKGYNYAIEAMYLLKMNGVDFKYTIIAEGELPESLIFMVNEYNLTSNIEFQTGMTQHELYKKMQTYDTLLLPSINEGIANVVVEAMAIGLLVVSSDCGGMSEVVIPEKTGWLCKVRNPESMAKSLLEVKTSSQQKRMELANNAFNNVKERFYGPKKIEEFIELYNSIDL
ncbi:MAG: glycosyltransferase [Winogradskyella sp.]|uniref:glycosyltransferase family 4 protein n=1 Tax=Winogradskyella sp. TaxID=1883156 RepID=UPI000F4176FA|nr:glycosyltransferase family 4 protein [Winogradskyella sp.]RNC86889.1 MAG: glycosyltransferase [Winogradskyella sp.]